jgi:hypothetical protein
MTKDIQPGYILNSIQNEEELLSSIGNAVLWPSMCKRIVQFH